MKPVASVSRYIATGSCLALIVLLSVWYGWLSPPDHIPAAPLLTVLVLPLLLPLRGMLRWRPYTFQWSLFLAMAYFTHGVVEVFGAPEDRGYALLEILLSLAWFVAAIVFVRTHARP